MLTLAFQYILKVDPVKHFGLLLILTAVDNESTLRLIQCTYCTLFGTTNRILATRVS